MIRSLAITALLLGVSAGAAAAQSLSMNIDSREQYAGVPFVITVRAEGFAEQPQPTPPPLAIRGCQVEDGGTVPQVQSFVDLNRRTQVRKVTYDFRYRVTCPPGGYEVPAVTLGHEGETASAGGGRIEVKDISTSPDMRLALELPDRPRWVGESFEVHLDWLLRRDVENQTFAVPLFDMEDTFQISVPETSGRRQGLAFQIGGREVMLPLERSKVVIDGREFVRLRMTARVTPLRAGAIELPPAQVVAAMEVGQTRDRYGFRVARTELASATTGPMTVQVKPLPLTGRPADFTGAVGSKFSLEASASRTVVGLGEPIELTLRVRSDRDLTGLSAPKLDVDGALDPDHFSLVGEPATGALSENARDKTFAVTVRLEDAAVDKIPALPLSYFDPATGQYHTVRSEPIALSVRGSAIVGADQVIGGEQAGGDQGPAGPAALVGADLALSDPGDTLEPARSVTSVRPVLAVLYVLPLLLLALRLWQLRTRAGREAGGEVAAAARGVQRAIEVAGSGPARDGAPALVTALRELARAGGVEPTAADRALLQRLDTEAFAPDAGDHPLASDLREAAAAAADRWRQQGRRAARTGRTGAAALLLLIGLGATGIARADTGELERARQLYQEALAADDRDVRARTFSSAAAGFAELAEAHPDRPALLVDWGNAALGAGDLGRAALAFRRALALDPGAERARRNLAWVRDRQPSWLPQPPERGAIDSLFFWHHRMTAAGKHLVAAAAFALAILLLCPWPIPARRRALLRRLAILPSALWIAMLASALLHPDQPGAAVLLAGDVTLRSADSAGAGAALTTPLPAGAEVVIRTERDAWTRIALPDGTTGWVPRSAVARVRP